MKTLPNTEQEKVAHLQAWCQEHADQGARVMTETWTADDYRDLLKQWGSSYERSLSHLERMARVYRGSLRSCEGYRPRSLVTH